MTTKEITHQRGNLRMVRFKGEVAGIEEMHFSFRQVSFVGLGARRNEERIVLAQGC